MTWGIDLESTAMVATDRHADMLAYAKQQRELKRAQAGDARRPTLWQRLRRALGGMTPEAQTEAATPRQSLLQS